MSVGSEGCRWGVKDILCIGVICPSFFQGRIGVYCLKGILLIVLSNCTLIFYKIDILDEFFYLGSIAIEFLRIKKQLNVVVVVLNCILIRISILELKPF